VFEETAAVDPATLCKDLFLALDETKNASDPTPVYVSLEQGLAKAALCKGELEACVKVPREDIKFAADTHAITGRKLFKSGTGLSVVDGQIFTILGFDAKGAIKAAQQFAAVDRNAVAP
jgi:hypothetical protein